MPESFLKKNEGLIEQRLFGHCLRGPVFIASSVLTGDIDRIRRAHEAGAGAVSTKMAVMSNPPDSRPDVILRGRGGGIVTPGDKRLVVDQARDLIAQIKGSTDLMVFANILAPANDPDAWKDLAVRMEEAGADALELDISCPNIPKEMVYDPKVPAGTCVAQFPDVSEMVTARVKDATRIPVLCKLTAQVTDIVEIGRACERGGADGLVAINGLRAAPPIDIFHEGRPRYVGIQRHNFGTLTGDPLFPLACRAVAELSRAVEVPVVGCGGVSTWRDVVEMMMWGAQAVQLCTAVLLGGFDVVHRVNQGLQNYLQQQGFSGIDEIVGLALAHLVPGDRVEHDLFDLSIDHDRCDLCGRCLAPGICRALQVQNGRIVVHNELCIDCGTCVQLCPRKAILTRMMRTQM